MILIHFEGRFKTAGSIHGKTERRSHRFKVPPKSQMILPNTLTSLTSQYFFATQCYVMLLAVSLPHLLSSDVNL